MLCSPVFAESNRRPFTLSLEGLALLTLALRNEGRREGSLDGLLLRLVPQPPRTDDALLATRCSLSSLESALPQNRRVTRLESALSKSLALNSFRIRTYRNTQGEGSELLTPPAAALYFLRSNKMDTMLKSRRMRHGSRNMIGVMRI